MTSISSATRAATDMAATRRGCVHATPFLLNRTLTHSKHHCGICKQPGCKLQLPWLAFLIIVHSISLKLQMDMEYQAALKHTRELAI